VLGLELLQFPVSWAGHVAGNLSSGCLYASQSQSQSHFTADRQSVSQSVCLGVEPTLWTFDQILFPFKTLGLEFVVLSLWDGLSDERPGLFFVKCLYTDAPRLKSY
jgi:hypothetical protein